MLLKINHTVKTAADTFYIDLNIGLSHNFSFSKIAFIHELISINCIFAIILKYHLLDYLLILK